MNNFLRLNLLLVSFLFAGVAGHASSIEQQVQDYVFSKWAADSSDLLEVEIQNSVAIKQWTCPAAIKIEHTSQRMQSNMQIKLKCLTDTVFWVRYLPISVAFFQQVVVTVEPVKRGSQLTKRKLQYQLKDVNKLTLGYFLDMSELEKNIAKRNLLANQVINPMMIDSPLVVNKGDTVMIVAKKGNLQIQMPGIALASGKVGKQISVKNRRSKRVIKARIKKQGLVEIVI